MACLTKTQYTGKIAWLGRVAENPTGVRSDAATSVHAGLDGVEGELHSGATRASCVRVTMLHPKGTEIRNTRQLSVLSAEENAEIAKELGLESLNPEWLGASIVIEGIPDFSHLPPGSRLQTSSGATLTVDLENEPCNWPGKEIEADKPGHGKAFKNAALGRRGVTAWVERAGDLTIGEKIHLFVPTQRPWAP